MSDSTVLSQGPCSACGSSDACTSYSDGHTHCFSCGDHRGGSVAEGVATPAGELGGNLLAIKPNDIPRRHITAAVCRSHGYGTTTFNGQPVQVANYCDDAGRVVAQKVRTPEKSFSILGDGKALRLWPQWRYRAAGKRLLITEGEIDCLAWQTLSGDRFPAVSVPNGAAGAAKAVKKSLDFVEAFEQVVICMDADEPGRKAAEEIAALLKPGKALVMKLPLGCKDICEAIQKGFTKELVDAFWQASPFRPDGIVGSAEILKALLTPPPMGHPYPWQGLTDMLLGSRTGELTTLTAGTGAGKSLIAGQIGQGWIRNGLRVGYISLEESLTRTAERLVGAELKRPIHTSREGISDAELIDTWNRVFDGKVCVFNHFGSMGAESLMNRVRYMRIAEGCDFIIIDHLSILVSGWDSNDGDERRLIDNVMTTLRSICSQTGVGMLLISHLRGTDAKSRSHEEGATPRLSDLRGSKSISQLSDNVIVIVRDQTAADSNVSDVHVLKNRLVGTIGRACRLRYDPATGLVSEIPITAETPQDHGF